MAEQKGEFTCARCGKTYTKVWTGDDAMESFKKDFPSHVNKKLDIVCVDCYKEIRQWYYNIN